MLLLPDVRVSSAKSMLLVDVNNRTCPVTGEPIVKKKFNTGYNGKRYWFSSYDAVRTFKENPGRYIKKAGRYSAPVRKTVGRAAPKVRRKSRSAW